MTGLINKSVLKTQQCIGWVFFRIFVQLSTFHPLISTLIIALDVLVNSAGILVSGATESLELDEFDRCWNINTRAGRVQKLVKPRFLKVHKHAM